MSIKPRFGHLHIGLPIDRSLPLSERYAIRAVILRGDKLIMVHTNRGDYKFAGGGKAPGECDIDTLVREIREELGRELCEYNSIELLLTADECNTDTYNKYGRFVGHSYYYACSIEDRELPQKLDDYEREQDFSIAFVEPDKAIAANEEILSRADHSRIPPNDWVYRDTLVLRELRRRGYFG